MKKKLKISLLLNIIIFVLVVVASVIMFTGFQFMHGVEPIFEERRLYVQIFFIFNFSTKKLYLNKEWCLKYVFRILIMKIPFSH